MKNTLVALSLLCLSSVAAFADGMKEAKQILTLSAKESGRPSYSKATAVKFSSDDNVYLKSTLAVDFTYNKATATLPLYRGLGPDGKDAYFIITEASDHKVADALGVNYAPKMRHAVGTRGAMPVTVENGLIKMPGAVDFSPKFEVVAGSPNPFPPKVAKPGAVADANYSSLAVMPSGVVLNVQVVANASGGHDRMPLPLAQANAA
ncbi:MAG: hypothetical protein SH859_09975 [Hyphomicrobium aestuarii]|nr:hypothetical protein [Hyphomicrobium aestuarii]